MMRNHLDVAALLLISMFALGCGASEPEPAAPVEQPAAPAAAAGSSALLDPQSPDVNQMAPEMFRAVFETSKGNVVIEVTRALAPKGADRFYNLVKNGFYDGVRFFRVLREPMPFMAQFGINGDPAVSQAWANANLEDDPVMGSNTRGAVTFATAGPNTRTTQLFINYGDNAFLDSQGFSPFGRVVEGMEVVDMFYAGYGEGAPNGMGPDQFRMEQEGNEYLMRDFPMLDYIVKATIAE